MSERILDFTFGQETPQRLDKYLVGQMPGFSRSQLQGLIREGLVCVNDMPAPKTGLALETGDQVRVHVPAPVPTELVPEPIPLDIRFENPDLIVVNKPAGMVVHTAAGHERGTLVQAVLAHAPEMQGIGGEGRPGVVHRLDKNTSGLILLAKHDAAHRWLQEQFRRREVEKIYLALVDGKPPTPTGRIEAPIGRDLARRKQMAVVPGRGRAAISEYRTLEAFAGHTLLEVRPLTGRTHQIRLHLSFLGCPVAGDTTYGRRKSSLAINRHFLHAARLTIRLPGEVRPTSFEAPLPSELAEVLQSLRLAV